MSGDYGLVAGFLAVEPVLDDEPLVVDVVPVVVVVPVFSFSLSLWALFLSFE